MHLALAWFCLSVNKLFLFRWKIRLFLLWKWVEDGHFVTFSFSLVLPSLPPPHFCLWQKDVRPHKTDRKGESGEGGWETPDNFYLCWPLLHDIAAIATCCFFFQEERSQCLPLEEQQFVWPVLHIRKAIVSCVFEHAQIQTAIAPPDMADWRPVYRFVFWLWAPCHWSVQDLPTPLTLLFAPQRCFRATFSQCLHRALKECDLLKVTLFCNSENKDQQYSVNSLDY